MAKMVSFMYFGPIMEGYLARAGKTGKTWSINSTVNHKTKQNALETTFGACSVQIILRLISWKKVNFFHLNLSLWYTCWEKWLTKLIRTSWRPIFLYQSFNPKRLRECMPYLFIDLLSKNHLPPGNSIYCMNYRVNKPNHIAWCFLIISGFFVE